MCSEETAASTIPSDAGRVPDENSEDCIYQVSGWRTMRAMFIASALAFLIYLAGAESIMTILGPVWFLVLGLGLLGLAGVSSGRH